MRPVISHKQRCQVEVLINHRIVSGVNTEKLLPILLELLLPFALKHQYKVVRIETRTSRWEVRFGLEPQQFLLGTQCLEPAQGGLSIIWMEPHRFSLDRFLDVAYVPELNKIISCGARLSIFVASKKIILTIDSIVDELKLEDRMFEQKPRKQSYLQYDWEIP